jgi:hypothetical protein
MLNYIKRLVKDTPNDAELGAKVRQYVSENRTCCDKKENHTTKIASYTQLMEDNEEIYCKKCGKFIKYA